MMIALHHRQSPTCHRCIIYRVAALALIAFVIYSPLGMSHAHAEEPTATPAPTAPMLAYYYIWFNPSSWNRAKTDYPLLGRYSSDDRAIMRAHIRLAKQVGITGFIVSWKSTDVLNRRLQRLIEVAESEDFKLAIIYQALDFERDPQPVEQIASDLDYFIKTFADRPAFDLFDQPMVVWSGTWEFSQDDISSVTTSRRDRLLILASERNPADYQRLIEDVDGNAYYWSSVDPESFPGYHEKLQAMSRVVHSSGGLWIAPAAPGFDARHMGGEQVVERKDGETLRREIDAALSSEPDAVGIISWNEFSENSHIEPSRQYEDQTLQTLAEITHAVGPDISGFDSDAPAATERGHGIPLLLGFAALLLINVGLIVRHDIRRRRPPLKPMTHGQERP